MLSKNIIQKIVVAGVVLEKSKILILQRHPTETTYPNMWELPSGKREPLELSEDAVKREVREEAGIDVEILSVISVFDYTIEKPDEIRDSTQINFLVSMRKDSKIILSSEHQNFAWVSEKDIDNYKLTEATKEVIKKGFKFNLK